MKTYTWHVRTHVAVLLSALCFCSATVNAQDKFVALSSSEDPTLDAIALVPQGGAASVTINDKKSAFTLKYSFAATGDYVYSAGISAPWSKDSDIGDLSRVGEFGNAASASLGLSRSLWPKVAPDKVVEYCKALKSVGEIFLQENTFTEEKKQLMRDEFSSCDDALVEKFYLAGAIPENFPSMTEFNEQWRSEFGYDKPIFGFGFDAAYSNPKYSYLDGASLEKGSRDVDEFKVTATFSAFTPGKNSIIKLNATRARSSKLSSTQICSPVGTTNSLSCGTQRIGPPVVTDASLLEFEYRKSLSQTAFAFNISRDVENDITRLSVPLWLKKIGGSDGYRTGVRLNWDSESEDVVATLFVGLFDLL